MLKYSTVLLWHPKSKMLEWFLIALLLAHSAWDCVAILALHFFPSALTVQEVYPSLFLLPQVREGGLVQRLLLYWMCSGSLCRLVACLFASQTGVWLGAALVYWMEALSLEYEAMLACTLIHSKARHVSLFSLVMGNACAVMCVYLAVQGRKNETNTVYLNSSKIL